MPETYFLRQQNFLQEFLSNEAANVPDEFMIVTFLLINS